AVRRGPRQEAQRGRLPGGAADGHQVPQGAGHPLVAAAQGLDGVRDLTPRPLPDKGGGGRTFLVPPPRFGEGVRGRGSLPAAPGPIVCNLLPSPNSSPTFANKSNSSARAAAARPSSGSTKRGA